MTSGADGHGTHRTGPRASTAATGARLACMVLLTVWRKSLTLLSRQCLPHGRAFAKVHAWTLPLPDQDSLSHMWLDWTMQELASKLQAHSCLSQLHSRPCTARRIMAPAVYIFFASLVPALAFGAQLYAETGGQYNGIHVLLSTSLAGITQAVIGGQPLLILGVAEPYILCVIYMYKFAKNQGFEADFVPWCTWTMFWLAGFVMALSVTGAHVMRSLTACSAF